MRIDQACETVADQQCFEDAVASHGGQVVGNQQRCAGRVTSPSSVTITPWWPVMGQKPNGDRKSGEA